MEARREHGPFKSHLEKIEGSLGEIKDDLASAIRAQTTAIRDQSDIKRDQIDVNKKMVDAVDNLRKQIEIWDRAVPVKLVMVMFGVLVASIGTIEAIRALLPLLKTL